MKNIFIWDEHNHYFIDEHGQYILQEKPIFSFEYDNLIYHKDTQSRFYDYEGFNLEKNECEEIENYIQQKRLEIGILKHCIDSNGKYLGYINKDESIVSKIVSSSPPTPDSFWIWNENDNNWKKAYYYDSNGKIVDANSPLAIGFTIISPPASILSQKWDILNEIWIDDYTTDEFNRYKKVESLNLVCIMISSLCSNTDIKIVLDELNDVFGDSFKYHLTKTALQEIDESNTSNDVTKTVQSVRDILLFN